MFGSVQSSILMFGEHYEHLGTSKVSQSVANMGYIKRKGAWLFKFLQRQIGGIPKCVEIFEKNFQYAFLDVPSYILYEKN